MAVSESLMAERRYGSRVITWTQIHQRNSTTAKTTYWHSYSDGGWPLANRQVIWENKAEQTNGGVKSCHTSSGLSRHLQSISHKRKRIAHETFSKIGHMLGHKARDNESWNSTLHPFWPGWAWNQQQQQQNIYRRVGTEQLTAEWKMVPDMNQKENKKLFSIGWKLKHNTHKPMGHNKSTF